MTTLTIPSLEWRFLKAVGEEAKARPVGEWPEESLRLCLDLLRPIRENIVGMRRTVEDRLAQGVEARSFAREYGPVLPAIREQAAQFREFTERLSSAGDAASARLREPVHSMILEMEAVRDLLEEALARASETPPPVDGERIRAAEEAHARGETKPLSPR